MSIIVGLDIGGSTTKIVALHKGSLISQKLVKASDPVASAYGALGKLLSENQLGLNSVERVMVTGVGASRLQGNLLEMPTIKTAEFRAIGLGGLFLSGCEEAIVVSMGTGTAIVHADRTEVKHIIGSGVGGGTMLGLAYKMINLRDFDLFNTMAQHGDLRHIDLVIGDITSDPIPGLAPDTTASNFGKLTDNASPEDLALGIVNLVFQSVGTAAVLCARLTGVGRIVFTGNLTRIHAGRNVLHSFASLYGVDVQAPESAEFATAIGAALCPP